jgi:hypothetical protein
MVNFSCRFAIFTKSDSASGITPRGEWCHRNDSTTAIALNCPLCWNGCCSRDTASPPKSAHSGDFHGLVASMGCGQQVFDHGTEVSPELKRAVEHVVRQINAARRI